MTPMSLTRLMEEFCRAFGKFAMFVLFDPSDVFPKGFDEVEKAAPYLKPDGGEMTQILADGAGFLVFDTEDEMRKYYDATVGDDGPTKANSYDGQMKVYALTCSPQGLENENT